jgi:hypothetical protein
MLSETSFDIDIIFNNAFKKWLEDDETKALILSIYAAEKKQYQN